MVFRSVLAMMTLLILAPEPASADYIADQFITITQGDFGGMRKIFLSKIYAQGKKLRIEIEVSGRLSINISRGDQDPPVYWTLMPKEKMYMETTGNPGTTNPLSFGSDGKYEKVFLAKEPVAGINTNKFRLVWKDKEGRRRTGLAWEAIELNNAPIRQEFFNEEEHVLVQLANIKIKKLDPMLFEIPSGYRKISMPPKTPEQ